MPGLTSLAARTEHLLIFFFFFCGTHFLKKHQIEHSKCHYVHVVLFYAEQTSKMQ